MPRQDWVYVKINELTPQSGLLWTPEASEITVLEGTVLEARSSAPVAVGDRVFFKPSPEHTHEVDESEKTCLVHHDALLAVIEVDND